MASSQPTIQELAAKVAQLSADFSKFLGDNKIPEPTFAADSVRSYSGLTSEAFLLRQNLLDTLNDLHYLVEGPSESVFNFAHNYGPDGACINTINHFDFWSAVPLNGDASYAEITKHVNLPEEVVHRLLEHAYTLRIFEETEPGKPLTTRVRHTARSAALAQNEGLSGLVANIMNDAGPPMAILPYALEKFQKGKTELKEDMSETAFALWQSGELSKGYKTSWEMMEEDGEGERKGYRMRTFVKWMNYIKDIFQLEGLLNTAYDWKSAGNLKVVDLGGSGGHDSFVLAKNFPNLNITVQDLPKCQSSFDQNIPEELKGRVSFQPHSFFEPQTLQADIYMIKLILHDWPDAESIQILKGLTPALRPGSKVLFIDYVGKQGTVEENAAAAAALPKSIQQMGTSTDLRMMGLFGAKERHVDAWKELFKRADERYDVARVTANPLSFFVVIEAVWRG
ncbi:O-methyltransferase [Colletotrichum karsti]|uniref:O-methyltransferase n=1 Tax=Colletotrichum karsti TaxID=1095194 RepID=A0A9P6LHE5_9PEZI|nr:O-methyltransferase [Colletotrichum karsti]KAF9872535.1 O-methyltransferase [Colletotrichum karsti]